MDSNRPGDNEMANAPADAEDTFSPTRESAMKGAPMALLATTQRTRRQRIRP